MIKRIKILWNISQNFNPFESFFRSVLQFKVLRLLKWEITLQLICAAQFSRVRASVKHILRWKAVFIF